MYFFNFFLFSVIIVSATGEQCNNVSSPRSYEFHLGTKTPYRTVANIDDSVLQFEGTI